MAISGFRGLDSTMQAAVQLRARFNEETRQAASGMRADSYAGLGADARRSVNLRSELSRREVLATNAGQAEGRASFAQTILGRFSDIASSISASAADGLGAMSTNRSLIAENARKALSEVTGLLRERYQGEAVFGGSDLQADPIMSPEEIFGSGLYTGIRDQMAQLGTSGAAAVLANTRALAGSNDPAITPFSAHAAAAARGEIDDPRRNVTVADGVRVDIGLYPNRDAAALPPGKDSTGSWSRDLLHGLSVLANLDAAPAESDVSAVLQGVIGVLRSARERVDNEAGALGYAQKRLDSARAENTEIGNQLEQQLGDLEAVDPAEAFIRLQATQTQLQASYKSLAMLGDLTLTSYLR
ncbi:flagellin [Muricoccus vinaceus]|uniref:Flagellin n=1 Tax=Muricoccus vinaceus TaxID=424704 RepID=A0ABV6ISQ4_9PROT